MTQRYQKNHPAENVSYYHHIFCAAIAHPDHKIALPPAPEPIMKTDGTTNDCKHNGAKGLLAASTEGHGFWLHIRGKRPVVSNKLKSPTYHSIGPYHLLGCLLFFVFSFHLLNRRKLFRFYGAILRDGDSQ